MCANPCVSKDFWLPDACNRRVTGVTFTKTINKEDKTMYRDGMDRYEEHNIVLENKILIPDSIYTELNWIFGVDVNAFDATVRGYIIKKITINDEQDGITLYLMHPTGGLMIVDIIAFKTDEGGVIIRVNKAEPTCVIHL